MLDGLELQRGQTVDQTLDKKFTGDVRQGLKVLGRYSLRYCVVYKYGLTMLIMSLIFFDICAMTVQCIQNPGVYLAKRLVKAKVRC